MLASVNSTYTDIMTSVFSSTIAAKAWFATAAIVLALVQLLTAARIFGKLKRVTTLSPLASWVTRSGWWSASTRREA